MVIVKSVIAYRAPTNGGIILHMASRRVLRGSAAKRFYGWPQDERAGYLGAVRARHVATATHGGVPYHFSELAATVCRVAENWWRRQAVGKWRRPWHRLGSN
jgi:hypothetical protein